MNELDPRQKTRVSASRLSELMVGLTGDGTRILRLLDDFHYAYGSQLQRLFFTGGTHEAKTRARNRALALLVRECLVYRSPRQPLPGKQHGEAEHIYGLTHPGQRVMNELRKTERPYRSINRTTAHFTHALAVTELHVQLVEAERVGLIELIQSQGEPACHRRFGLRKVLKPDAYTLFRTVRGGQKLEVAWFIEVEHSRQGETATIAKLHTYRDYMEHLDPDTGLMPKVIFVAFTKRHRDHLERLLDRNTAGYRDVFEVSEMQHATRTMVIGAESGAN